MRIEVTIAKSTVLPAGALDALAGELSRRINSTFPENDGAVRYVMQQQTIFPSSAARKKTKNASAKFCRKHGKAPTTGSSLLKICSLIVFFCRVAPAFFRFVS